MAYFYVSGVVAEMLARNAVTMLPLDEKPLVMSLMGAVRKPQADKFKLTVNMRYVNRHMGSRIFKLKGLKDLADLAEKGDHAVSYYLMSECYHVGLDPRSRTYIGFKWQGRCYVYKCPPLVLSTILWILSKVMRELVMFLEEGQPQSTPLP